MKLMYESAECCVSFSSERCILEEQKLSWDKIGI